MIAVFETNGVQPVTGSEPSTPDHISPTGAKMYLGCSLKFFFEKILKIRKPVPAALHCGKAIHGALQAFHLARWRGEDDSREAVSRAYEEGFVNLEQDEGPVRFEDEGEREKVREAGLRTVLAYLDSEEALSEPPLGVEVSLTETVPGLSLPLTGTMDLVTRMVVPVDFKSASSKPDRDLAAFDHEIQLVTYQLLLERGADATPPSLDLVYLVKTKTPQVMRVSIPPADQRRKDRVIRLLDTAVEGIAAKRFHPQPSLACSWCQFRRECGAWSGDAPMRAGT